MAWVRVDDSFYDHEKFMDVRMSAVGVWLATMAWCNRHETDGLIPAKVVKRFAKQDEAAELVEAGLWIPLDGGGFQIHGFLDYQPSKASRDEKRSRDRERLSKRRSTSQDVAGDTHAIAEGSQDVVAPNPTQPNPPHPDPTQPDPDAIDQLAELIRATHRLEAKDLVWLGEEISRCTAHGHSPAAVLSVGKGSLTGANSPPAALRARLRTLAKSAPTPPSDERTPEHYGCGRCDGSGWQADKWDGESNHLPLERCPGYLRSVPAGEAS